MVITHHTNTKIQAKKNTAQGGVIHIISAATLKQAAQASYI